MPEFRCRTLKPTVTDWVKVSAESCGEAANEYHFKWNRVAVKYRTEDGTYIHFASVEVEGHGKFIVRSFHRGITRKGRATNLTLHEIAKQLEYTEPPETLVGTPWEGEEEEWCGP